MADLETIRKNLAQYRPDLLEAERRAAVALVLRGPRAEPEALFIERARHDRDPWSGHMALPGGRVDPGDDGPRAAAERETLEEVGVDLGPAECLGRLDDLTGRHAGRRAGLVISAFVYHHPAPAPVQANDEVETALWVPLSTLWDPERRVDHRIREDRRPFPGIQVSDAAAHVVWGLTYRFLEVFLAVAERPLPNRWEAFRPGADASGSDERGRNR